MSQDKVVIHARKFKARECPCCGFMSVSQETDTDDVQTYRCNVCSAEASFRGDEVRLYCECGDVGCCECESRLVRSKDSVECLRCKSEGVGSWEPSESGSRRFTGSGHLIQILSEMQGKECECCGSRDIEYLPGVVGWYCSNCRASVVRNKEHAEYTVHCGCDEDPYCHECGSAVISIEEEGHEFELECEGCGQELMTPAKVP